MGGWQATRNGETRAILFQGASEGLDPLTARDGLGLVPFAIEIHASQMGTLTRLLHAVELSLGPEGWAIDENTLLQVDANVMRVYGQGHATMCGAIMISRYGLRFTPLLHPPNHSWYNETVHEPIQMRSLPIGSHEPIVGDKGTPRFSSLKHSNS